MLATAAHRGSRPRSYASTIQTFCSCRTTCTLTAFCPIATAQRRKNPSNILKHFAKLSASLVDPRQQLDTQQSGNRIRLLLNLYFYPLNSLHTSFFHVQPQVLFYMSDNVFNLLRFSAILTCFRATRAVLPSILSVLFGNFNIYYTITFTLRLCLQVLLILSLQICYYLATGFNNVIKVSL